MSFKALIIFTLFNLSSSRKYYQKEFLLMTINKIIKITLPKKSSSNSCIAKKAQYSSYNGAEGGENDNELLKPQINHDITENTTSHQTTRSTIVRSYTHQLCPLVTSF